MLWYSFLSLRMKDSLSISRLWYSLVAVIAFWRASIRLLRSLNSFAAFLPRASASAFSMSILNDVPPLVDPDASGFSSLTSDLNVPGGSVLLLVVYSLRAGTLGCYSVC